MEVAVACGACVLATAGSPRLTVGVDVGVRWPIVVMVGVVGWSVVSSAVITTGSASWWRATYVVMAASCSAVRVSRRAYRWLMSSSMTTDLGSALCMVDTNCRVVGTSHLLQWRHGSTMVGSVWRLQCQTKVSSGGGETTWSGSSAVVEFLCGGMDCCATLSCTAVGRLCG